MITTNSFALTLRSGMPCSETQTGKQITLEGWWTPDLASSRALQSPPGFIAHADTLERSTPGVTGDRQARHPADRRLTDASSCRRRLGRLLHAVLPLTCVGRSFVDTDQRIRDSAGRANCRLPRLRTLEERKPPKTEVCGGLGLGLTHDIYGRGRFSAFGRKLTGASSCTKYSRRSSSRNGAR